MRPPSGPPRRPAEPPARQPRTVSSKPAVGAPSVTTPPAPAAQRPSMRSVSSRSAGSPVSPASPVSTPQPVVTVDERPSRSSASATVSTQLQERLREQQQAAAKLRRIRLGLGAGVAALVIGLVYLLLFSPVFAVSADKVEIVGTTDPQALSAIKAQVRQIDGTPLLRLNVGGVVDDLTQIPQVRGATVNRAWPNGLLIHIEPREVAVGIATDEGFALLDREAVQIGLVEAVPDGVPTIRARLESIDQRTLASVLAMIDSMDPDLASDVASIQVENQDNIRLTLTDGARVEWGSGEDNVLKAEVLMLLRSNEQASEGVEVYDVSSPTMPVTR